MAIFDFMKRTTENKVMDSGKTANELIQEIHETFHTEVDRLLEEAGIMGSLSTNKQDLIDKKTRLERLGFSNTSEVKKASPEVERLSEIESSNDEKWKLIKTIQYFSDKYPLYKFITEDSVKKICQKYSLVYGNVNRYFGDVPDKNLEQIENFKIHKEDELYYEVRHFGDSDRCMSRSDYEFWNRNERRGDRYYKAPLEIAAPQKDFNMEGLTIKDFKIVPVKIEIPDPVVLQPVFRNGNKYYLIVTAWGEESSDELVVNQNFN